MMLATKAPAFSPRTFLNCSWTLSAERMFFSRSIGRRLLLLPFSFRRASLPLVFAVETAMSLYLLDGEPPIGARSRVLLVDVGFFSPQALGIKAGLSHGLPGHNVDARDSPDRLISQQRLQLVLGLLPPLGGLSL